MPFEEQYNLWDQFLETWPLERLSKMTLNEYSSQGSRDTFTYWIEHRLKGLGSIKGGSSFKFGVYSRAQGGADIKDDATRSYTPDYAWYSRLGETAVAAFEKVKDSIIEAANFSAKGELYSIDNVEYLGESYKWKIAFLYQDRNNPIIAGVFKREMLSAFLGNPDINTMAALQKASIAKKPLGNL
jgi:5-methylcytosine-specific restriction protein B